MPEALGNPGIKALLVGWRSDGCWAEQTRRVAGSPTGPRGDAVEGATPTCCTWLAQQSRQEAGKPELVGWKEVDEKTEGRVGQKAMVASVYQPSHLLPVIYVTG